MMARTHGGAVAPLLLAVCAVILPARLTSQTLQTGPERSGFTEYTSYAEMMDYLHALGGTTTEMALGTYGETRQGRALPYAVLSRPLVTRPEDAALLGRPVLVLAANVHGGERTLRESLLLLLREMVTPGTEANAYLDDVVIVVTPQINPDGFSATARGQRGNAWGIDLNRDYIKLEHPAIAGYVLNIIRRWNPHLFVDGHNGGAFPYNLNYQCPSHADPDIRITLLCDEEIFPAVNARLEAAGYRGWYYQRGNETRWNGGGSDARIGRNYGGFSNTVGILFESPPTQEMRVGVAAGVLAYKAVVEYAIANPDRLISTVERARRETIELGMRAEGDVVVQMEYAPEDYQVTYQIGVETAGGQREVRTIVSDSLMKKPVATKTRPRPYAYLLPRDAEDAVAMLRRHDITVQVLQEDTELEVSAYVLEGASYEQAYNHGAATRVTLADDPVTLSRSFPAGTYVVPTGQVLGRVVTHMLEPETNDNVIYWNTMDAWIPKAQLDGTSRDDGPPLVPIFKVMVPTAMSLEMVP